MSENNSELLKRLVVGSKRDGRRRYDKQAKLELVQACLQPGISVARIAYEHGVNANLLRKWINLYQHQHGPSPPTSLPHERTSAPAFIPVVPVNAACAANRSRLHAKLPNGIEIDLSGANGNELSSLLELLCTLPCSASTPR
jgi:transposase